MFKQLNPESPAQRLERLDETTWHLADRVEVMGRAIGPLLTALDDLCNAVSSGSPSERNRQVKRIREVLQRVERPVIEE